MHGHLVIVSLYYNPKFVDNNEESAEFLGGADYITIQKELNMKLPRCKNWNQVNSIVRQLKEAGVKDYVKRIILEHKPT